MKVIFPYEKNTYHKQRYIKYLCYICKDSKREKMGGESPKTYKFLHYLPNFLFRRHVMKTMCRYIYITLIAKNKHEIKVAIAIQICPIRCILEITQCYSNSFKNSYQSLQCSTKYSGNQYYYISQFTHSYYMSKLEQPFQNYP